jgi:hypothetical protein
VNHNGGSEAGELRTLPDLRIQAISLTYRETSRHDGFGNWFRYRAKVTDTQGSNAGRWAYDVFLHRTP